MFFCYSIASVVRPKANTSAPKTIDASEFTKIGSALSSSKSSASSSSSSAAPKAKQTAAPTATDLAFDDDAWEVRDTVKFDYDNWKIQNRDNEDEWIEKFASSTAPKVASEESETTASPKTKESKVEESSSSPAGRSRPGAPKRTESNNSLSSLGLSAPLTPASAPAPASPAPAPSPSPSPAKPASPAPGSLDAIKLTQAEEAERVRQQMEKIREKQANDNVKRELEQVKQQQQMLQQALVQQANQNSQLVQTIRRLAPPPPVSAPKLPAPLVPVNPTGPMRFIPTHPTGQLRPPPPPPQPFSTANIGLPSVQQQMMTGVTPQMTGIAPQATGKAHWANACKF